MSDPTRPLPQRLADFDVIRRLGMGGMAEVFLAKKRGAEGTYKLLVLKRILPAYASSRRFRAMFAEEAQLATRLNHPNIVQVYDFQDYGEDGQLLSMEYVDGPDLRRFIKAARQKQHSIPAPLCAYIVAEVAKGLHYAHERKDEGGRPLDIVHRDVSPQNVLLSLDGAVKVADFGIASANMFREEPGVLKGKTAYMSPEQARGEKVDRRTDIYSLGVVLFEMLAGRPLHGDLEGDELLEAVRRGKVEPPSTYALGVPPELDELVLKALAVDPADRFKTAREMAAALQRALFEMHELVDGHSIEAAIEQLIGRPQDPLEPPRAEAEPEASASVLGGSEGSSAELDEDTGVGTPVQPPAAKRKAGQEVRHVAVVALRLQGFEELARLVGGAQARAVADRLKATFQEIAFKRNIRLDWSAGDTLFPEAYAVAGLMANPTGAAADAVWFAVDAHDVTQGAAADLPAELTASIGIVRGIASGSRDPAGHLMDAEVQTPALVLSNRLRQVAGPGVSLVAGGLYRLVRRDFLWGDVPTVEIENAESQGLPRNMRVYSLLRPLTREEKLQEMALAPSELIGRDAELADLHASYYSVVGATPGQGRSATRVVSGDLGIGKTALVSAFVNELPPDARVLRAECSPVRQDLPYATLAHWIRELTGVEVEQPLEAAIGLVHTALGEWGNPDEEQAMAERMAELAIGSATKAQDDGEDAHNRALLFSGFRHLLARAASEGPLVVVLDGLQWCDQQTLELVSELVHTEEPLPMLVLLVTRPDERSARYIAGLVRIDLAGLSTENQARLLQARLGVGPGVERVCADVLPRAAGNPFFLLEIVDALLERGVLEIREDGEGKQSLERVEVAGSVVTLPSTLEQLIADRLAELPRAEQELIDWLAVAGGPLPERDLRHLCGPHTEKALQSLCARGLCEVRGDQVDVRHPLTRDVAYRSMEEESRSRMHRALGELLAEGPLGQGLNAAVVARHLARGGARDRAAEYYLEAAGAARSSYQIPLATRCYRKVAAMLPADDPRLLEVHEALEAIARNEGKWRPRRLHLARLRELARTSRKGYWIATALLRTARYQLDAGQLTKALASARLGEKAAEASGSAILLVQAQALLAAVLRDLGDMQGALAAVDRGLASAEHPDVTARLRAEALMIKGTLLRRVGRVLEAVEVYAESIAVFQRVGARRMEARAKSSMAFAMYVLGRVEDGVALGLDALQIDLAIGGRFQVAKTLSNIGLCYAGAGDYERAMSYLNRARESHERYGEHDSRADTLLAMAEVLIEQRDLAAAQTLVGDAAALTQVTQSAYDTIHERLLRAVLAYEMGDGRAAVERAFDARQAAEAQAYAAFHFYAMAVEAAARVAVGEVHTGVLLATTALGAIDTLQGSEYGLQTRALCVEALQRAGSPQAPELRGRALRFVEKLSGSLRNPELRKRFARRPAVAFLGGDATPARAVRPADQGTTSGGRSIDVGKSRVGSSRPGEQDA